MRDADDAASSSDDQRARIAAFAEQDHRGLRRRVRLGLATQFLSLLSKVAAQLVTVPFFILAWGVPLFGEWLILQALAGLLQLAACGQHFFFSNRIRNAWSIRDHANVRVYFRRGMTFFASLYTITIILFLLSLLAIDFSSLLNLNNISETTAFLVLLFLTIQMHTQTAREVITSIYHANGELYIAELIRTVANVARVSLLIILLLAGTAPLGIAMFLVLFGLFINWMILLLDYARRFRWIFGGPDFRFISELRPSQIWIYAVPHAAMHVPTFLPAVLLGAFAYSGREVVQFNLVRTFTGLLTVWSQQAAKVSGLEISRQRFQSDGLRRARFASRAARTFGVAVGFVGGVMFGLVEPVFRIWTAGEVEPMLALVAVLMARTIANSVGQYWLAALRLSDHMRDAARTGVGFILFSVVGAVVGVQLGGVVGLAVGLLLADAVFSLLWPALLFARRVWDGRLTPALVVGVVTILGFATGWLVGAALAPVAEAAVRLVQS